MDTCSAMLQDPNRLFYSIFTSTDTGRAIGEPGCLGQTAELRRAFFADVLSGSSCDQDFYAGYSGFPEYGADVAPALVGFDFSMLEYCLRALGQARHVWWASPRQIASTCIAANSNVFKPKWGWSMCNNLRWQLCAAQGLLHGQNGQNGVRFTPAPSTLRLNGENPPKRPGGRGVSFGDVDVYYLEVCIFAQVCSNGADIFGLVEGQIFNCQLDEALFGEFQAMITAGIGGPFVVNAG